MPGSTCRERIITGAQGVESPDEIAGGWCIGHAPDETCPGMGCFGNGGEADGKNKIAN
jgi:hypothetical protein